MAEAQLNLRHELSGARAVATRRAPGFDTADLKDAMELLDELNA